MGEWNSIEDAPAWSGNGSNEILCGFRGQFNWVSFVAIANGPNTFQPGFAKPTHWTNIPEPPDEPA